MILIAAAILAGTPMNQTFRQWGEETLDTIRRDYYIPAKGLYGEAIVPGQPPKDIAFNWSCGVLLSALVAGARHNRKYDPWLRDFADNMHSYWNTKGPVPGFDVLPAPKPVDRYYDDNAWMAMALVETYEHLPDPKYLRWADETVRYVLSGESSDLGGGIFWKEAEKTSKNTCSNGPAAAACLAVYRHTQDKNLLDKAVQIYAWTKRNLQDPSDGLFWDSINLKGKIEKTKWSYNTALMIRTAVELYDITKLPSYREEALRMTRSSVSHWLVDGRLRDEGRFAHLLYEAWLRVGSRLGDASAADAAGAALRYLHDHVRSADGLYSGRWYGEAPKSNAKVELIDQASVARAWLVED